MHERNCRTLEWLRLFKKAAQPAGRRERREGRSGSGYEVEILEQRVLLSAATLVKDINSGTLGSNAQPLATVGGATFFAADDGIKGQGLWKTSGSGATFVASASIPKYSTGVAYEGKCFFNGSSSGSLWESDGTSAGTMLVSYVWNTPSDFTIAGGKLFFETAATYGYPQSGFPETLWVSDGTASGTLAVEQLQPQLSGEINSLTAFNNKVYFLASGTQSFTEDLWVSDGTSAGTQMLFSGLIQPVSSSDTNLVVYGGKLYFMSGAGRGGAELWTSDGTAAGIHLVANVYQMTDLTASSTGLHFAAADQMNSSDTALWKSDGTAAGTVQVQGGFGGIVGIGALPNGSVVFSIWQGGSAYAVYASNGTAVGTHLLSNTQTQTFGPLGWTPAGNNLLFVASDTNSTQVYSTDGTPAGTRALTINPYYYPHPLDLMSSGGIAYFEADDGFHGAELWKSDGTQAGTQMVADINQQPASSSPGPVTQINGKLYFSATDQHGTQPWVSDGTAGTHLLSDLGDNPGASQASFEVAAGKVFFRDFTPNEAPNHSGFDMLYASDGTSAGTYPVTTLASNTFASFDNAIYFAHTDSAHGIELWKTDGTTADTVLVDDLVPGTGSSTPGDLTSFNGKLLFDATMGNATQLYASDGTAAGTRALTGFPSNSGDPLQYVAAANGRLYFALSVYGIGVQLWQTDGTPAGTSMIEPLEGSNGYISSITASGSTLYAVTGVLNSSIADIYKSDGTAAGTTLLSLPSWEVGTLFVQMKDKLFFSGNYGPYGGLNESLWVSDGTAAGTMRITQYPLPANLTNADGTLLFSANDGVNGNELWTSDGTVAGTRMLQDINPGPGSSNPSNMVLVGNTLYLAADDGVHGSELMQIGLGASISGSVFNDANNNGIADSGEPGLAGVTVYLDVNNDGKFDSGDISTATDSSGKYVFQNVNPGTYAVREVLPSGDAQTSPMGYSTTVPVAITQDTAGPVFGNVPISSVTMNLSYFLTLSRNFGKPGTFASGDLNGDGTVNLSDLLLLVRHFGHTLAPSPLLVTSTADDGSLGTLRYAIAHSNPGDTISFSPGVFAAGSSHVITLAAGQLEISHNLTIAGPGAANLSISGNNASRVFQVDSGVTANLSGLTITNGNAGAGNNGGGISNSGTLDLSGVVITANAAGFGAGIYTQGVANLTNCTLSNNAASTNGGGIDTHTSATLIGCTVTNNRTAAGSGGGVLDNGGTVTLINDTITANSDAGGSGGGVANVQGGTLTIADCTIAANAAANAGAGVYLASGSVTINNTVVAGDTYLNSSTPNDVSGTLAGSYNLIGDGSGGLTSANHNLLGKTSSLLDPKLGVLSNNGGPTLTMLPQTGSPLIDAGGNALVPTGTATDQRGYVRIVNGTVDIGACESNSTAALSPILGSSAVAASSSRTLAVRRSR